MKKASAEAAIADLPETFDLDLLVERLLVIEKIEKGLEDVREGRVIPNEEVEAYFRKNGKSSLDQNRPRRFGGNWGLYC